MKPANHNRKAPARKLGRRPMEPKSAFNLVERRFNARRFVEFPQIKGKSIEKLELFTSSEQHSIDIEFEDSTSLSLNIEPCFILRAAYYDVTGEKEPIVDEWVPVHSATNLS
jgi:hypothetical protein